MLIATSRSRCSVGYNFDAAGFGDLKGLRGECDANAHPAVASTKLGQACEFLELCFLTLLMAWVQQEGRKVIFTPACDL